MALAEMNKLRDEAIAKFSLLDTRIVHRVGVVGQSVDDRRIEAACADLEKGVTPQGDTPSLNKVG